MAKANKKAAAPKKAAANGEATGRRNNIVYKLLKKVPAEGISPQLKVILEVIDGAGGEISRPKLMDALGKKLGETVQTPQKIFSFYKKDMINKGLVREVKAAA